MIKITSELKKGIKVESEHIETYNFIKSFLKKHNQLPPKKQVYKSIAHEHIKYEDQKYYTKLKKCGL